MLRAAWRRLAGGVPAWLETPLLLAGIALVEFLVPWVLVRGPVTLLLAGAVTVRFVIQSIRHARLAVRVRTVLRTRFFELALTAAAAALLVSKASVWVRMLLDPAVRSKLEPVYGQYAIAFLVVALLRAVAGGLNARRLLHRLELMPAQTVAIGFAVTAVAGAIVLAVPLALSQLEALSLLDILFTAVSAVTVTGLAVYDPGTFHTTFGQVVLLVLIQLGGLGTMAASASLVVLAGRRLRLRQTAALRESMDLQALGDVRGQIRAVVLVTLGAEAVGAAALYVLWRGNPAVERPIFAAVFHAVSAFCNAGFSTFATSFVPFRGDAGTNAVIATLVVLGGIGFPVFPVAARLVPALLLRAKRPVLTLHARLVLAMTGALLVLGFMLALITEWRHTLAGLPVLDRLLAAGFLSVTSRTAGFNTLDTSALSAATLWGLMLLMFVGGSPGSTAGGIKTTTAATVLATLVGTLRGRSRVRAFCRTIPDEQVQKALAIVGVSTATVAAGVGALLLTQAALPPMGLVFEAVSAFATVGLSTGVTPALDPLGKLVVMGLMFVGRTGPLTLGFALALRAERSHVTYPSEKIMLG